MEISGDTLITIGHINVSGSVYEQFDIATQSLMVQYYGHGFIAYEDQIIYVQAPQHFSGISGYHQILNSDGAMLYESEENMGISGELKIDGDTLIIEEINLDTYERQSKSLDIENITSIDESFDYYA